MWSYLELPILTRSLPKSTKLTVSFEAVTRLLSKTVGFVSGRVFSVASWIILSLLSLLAKLAMVAPATNKSADGFRTTVSNNNYLAVKRLSSLLMMFFHRHNKRVIGTASFVRLHQAFELMLLPCLPSCWTQENLPPALLFTSRYVKEIFHQLLRYYRLLRFVFL